MSSQLEQAPNTAFVQFKQSAEGVRIHASSVPSATHLMTFNLYESFEAACTDAVVNFQRNDNNTSTLVCELLH